MWRGLESDRATAGEGGGGRAWVSWLSHRSLDACATRGRAMAGPITTTTSSSPTNDHPQGYCIVPGDKRFLLLFTFLKRNLNRKVRGEVGRGLVPHGSRVRR